MASPEDGAKQPPQERPRRPGAYYLMTVAGIPVYLHFTFVLMLLFIAGVEFSGGREIFGGLLFVLCAFASVALHELGHALMARRFGIKTEDIVLYPIGGVARLRSMGEGLQEFWISLAGPAVNILIAALIAAGLLLTGRWVPLTVVVQSMVQAEAGGDQAAVQGSYFLQHLMMLNIFLVIFNLIPAFPMDGGRVLRSILAQKLPKARATGVAAKIGQALAVLFMVWGIFGGGIFLLIIGVFVFLAAGQEFAHTRSVDLMAGRRMRDAMVAHFETLSHGDSLGRAADLLLATSQQDFPVMGGGEVIGVLGRKALIEGLATHGRDHYVAEIMARQFPRVAIEEPLQKAFDLMQEHGGLPVLVFDGDNLLGYINQENLMEFLMIAQSQRQGH